MQVAQPWQGAVAGDPIAHSLSPSLHLAAYQLLGIQASYERIQTGVERLPELLERCRATPTFRGLSLTRPLKHAAAKAADQLHGDALTLGVCNTLVFQRSNASPVLSHGYNTDVAGMVQALRWHGVSAQQDSSRAWSVIGSGDTAISALAAARQLGAGHVRVHKRSQHALPALAAIAEQLGLSLSVHTVEQPWTGSAADIVLCTLPAGAADAYLNSITAPATVLDVAYNPWPSALARQVSAQGGTIISGLDMLVAQAMEQVRLFAGIEQDSWDEPTSKALEAAMRESVP